MRSLCLFLLGAASAFSQPFSFGVKGGVPLTDFLQVARNQNFSVSTTTHRYIVGGTAELRLPFGLGVEFDALYRRLDYTGTGASTIITSIFTSSQTTANAWEFPLLAKYRFPTRIVRPYVDAGVAWDTLQGLQQTIQQTLLPGGSSTKTTSNPPELNKKTTTGFVAGFGVEIKALLIRVSPEIRYTRWGTQHFSDPLGLVHSNQSQGEFLLGITF